MSAGRSGAVAYKAASTRVALLMMEELAVCPKMAVSTTPCEGWHKEAKQAQDSRIGEGASGNYVGTAHPCCLNKWYVFPLVHLYILDEEACRLQRVKRMVVGNSASVATSVQSKGQKFAVSSSV